jgi:hypothetical protein
MRRGQTDVFTVGGSPLKAQGRKNKKSAMNPGKYSLIFL